MPRTAVPVTQLTRAGVDHGADASEVAGDTVNDHTLDINSGTEFLSVRNSGASPHDLTLVTPGTVDGEAIADKTITIPASATGKNIGPFPQAIYGTLAATDRGKLVFTVDHAELMLLGFKV